MGAPEAFQDDPLLQFEERVPRRRRKKDPDKGFTRESAGEILAVMFRRALRSVRKEGKIRGDARYLNRGITRRRAWPAAQGDHVTHCGLDLKIMIGRILASTLVEPKVIRESSEGIAIFGIDA